MVTCHWLQVLWHRALIIDVRKIFRLVEKDLYLQVGIFIQDLQVCKTLLKSHSYHNKSFYLVILYLTGNFTSLQFPTSEVLQYEFNTSLYKIHMVVRMKCGFNQILQTHIQKNVIPCEIYTTDGFNNNKLQTIQSFTGFLPLKILHKNSWWKWVLAFAGLGLDSYRARNMLNHCIPHHKIKKWIHISYTTYLYNRT